VTNETVEANKTEIKIENEKTDEKAPEPVKKEEPKKIEEPIKPKKEEPKKEESEGYTDQDIADVKYTPRKDDDIDSKNKTSKGPRSPLPHGQEEIDYE